MKFAKICVDCSRRTRNAVIENEDSNSALHEYYTTLHVSVYLQKSSEEARQRNEPKIGREAGQYGGNKCKKQCRQYDCSSTSRIGQETPQMGTADDAGERNCTQHTLLFGGQQQITFCYR